MRMTMCWCAILGHNHTIWCFKKIYQNNFSSAICMSSARFAKVRDMPMAPSFISPKSHRSLASHQAQAGKTSRCWSRIRLKNTCFEGYVSFTVFLGGTFLFENSKRHLADFSFPRSVQLWFGIYGWDQNHFTKSRFFRHKPQKKNAPETLLPSNARQVTWSVFWPVTSLEVPSPRQWRSNDNEGPSW